MAFQRTILSLISASILCFTCCLAAQTPTPPSSQDGGSPRTLRVVLYPFIPGFEASAEYIKLRFESEHPGVTLEIIDLHTNYYNSADDNYVGAVDADVYELDSVFLRDFVAQGKIVELPSEALLSPDQLLNNADRGTRLDGKRYGAAHWVCRDFLFFAVADTPNPPIATLSDLKKFIGSGRGIIMDLRGKSTLGEYYLVSAIDHYGDWKLIYPSKVEKMDPSVEQDVLALGKLCDKASCRSMVLHDYTGTHGAEFARKQGKALIGYSESLHDTLTETASCSDPAACLSDKQIDVADLPLDDAGSRPMTWVDSFTLSKSCSTKTACSQDAVAFIRMMNQDDTYRTLLFPASLPFLKAPKSYPPVPAYLLPAKSSLYSDQTILASAHLYPKLRMLVENAEVPTDIHLNDDLRAIGKQIDKDLDNPNP